MKFLVESVYSNIGITNEAVFPVPFLALAIILAPEIAKGMVSSYTGDGLSQPFSIIALNKLLFNP